MEKTELIIIGAGGFGREVASMLLNDKKFSHIGYLDQGLAPGTMVNGKEVMGPFESLDNIDFKRMAFVIAIANTKVRAEIVEKLKAYNLYFPNIIHPQVQIQDPNFVEMGKGNIICNGTILTCNIKMGSFNIINLSCTVGHDTIFEHYCSIMPAVNISGGAQFQSQVFVGTGAKLIKSTKLGRGCVVGAGSVVNLDIPPLETWAGVPARKLN